MGLRAFAALAAILMGGLMAALPGAAAGWPQGRCLRGAGGLGL